MEDNAVGGIKNIVVQKGKEAEFIRLFSKMLKLIKEKEEGNVYYDLYKSRTKERTYVVTERYTDRSAWQAHQGSEYGKIYFPKIRAVLETISVEYFDSIK
jgi:quinol monooxygenase YgiN